ncbi:Oligopeptide-binding protein AppA precursor [Luteitalea pratensis]|uniref:Oligopeptide-binding protein AppA n=1 Tax=Luteitalea pratensis TaxID=1855912 RepID=A0A143PY90_LUTPR|nr:ABC transporter substrate-binding protein [Luteitalea pratensis]AMY12759.1 Oligopeptide-binding protein AppA precursor [Luteitalea pratensis]
MLLVFACLPGIVIATAGCGRADAPAAAVPARITVALPSADVPIAPLLFLLTQTRLVSVDQTGIEQPALIERWTRSDDQRTWTLFVRDGVRLHDGRIVTAADVVTRVREAVDRPSTPGLWPVTSVEEAGPREVRVHLREPTSLLLESLSVTQAVDAGAYQAKDDAPAEPELVAVPQSGHGPPSIGTIQVRRYETPRAAVAALLREDVDVLYEVPSEARGLLAVEDGVQIFPNVKPYVITLGFNHRHPILRRRDVRLAMNIAVDRQALVAQVAGGVGIPAADMLWHQHWTHPHVDDAQAFPVDRQRAGQLLDASGLQQRRTPTGAIEPRFRVTCLVVDDPMMQRIARRLQKAYADIGISIDLEPIALEALGTRLASGHFDAFVSPVVSGYGMSMPYASFGNHGHPRMIDHGYTAAAPAAELVRAAATREAFVEAVHALHRTLIEDPPAVSLFWSETSRAVGRRVTVPDSSGDVLGSLARWTVRSKGQ